MAKMPETNRYWAESNGEGGSITVTFCSKEELNEIREKYPDEDVPGTVLITSRGKDKDFTVQEIREIGEHLIQIAEYFEDD